MHILPCDEKVCRLSNLPVNHKRDQDKKVAKGGYDDADGQADGDEDCQWLAERGRPALWSARYVLHSGRDLCGRDCGRIMAVD